MVRDWGGPRAAAIRGPPAGSDGDRASVALRRLRNIRGNSAEEGVSGWFGLFPCLTSWGGRGGGGGGLDPTELLRSRRH